MLRVLIGFPFGRRMGGADQLLWRLLLERRAVDLDPHLLLFADGDLRAAAEAEGIEVTVIDPGRFRQPWRHAAAVARAAALIRSTRPDLVISWLPRVQTVLAPAAVLARRADRLVYFVHELPSWRLNRIALQLPSRWLVANSSATLAASQAVWPHRDGTVVWPGIPAPPHAPPARLDELRSQLGLGRRPVVGIVGRLLGLKGQRELIEATALLRDEGTDIDLLVVGGEAHGVEAGIEAELRGLVDRLGVGDRVLLVGHVDDATPYLELMDVVVSAAVGEAFGLGLVEAMALGVPVMAVASGGPAEIVEHDVTGLLVRDNEPAQLAAGIRRMLDAGYAGRLASNALQRFRADFGEERMLAEWRRTLHGLVTEREKA